MNWFKKINISTEKIIEKRLPENLEELINDVENQDPKSTVIWTAGSLAYLLNLIKKSIDDR